MSPSAPLSQEAGYRTMYAGKYLNQYGEGAGGGVQHVPPGWDWWLGLVGNSRYYNYTLSVNGKAKSHGDNYVRDYLTDVIRRHAVSFLDSVYKVQIFSNAHLLTRNIYDCLNIFIRPARSLRS